MAVTREQFESGMTYGAYKAQMTRNREQLEQMVWADEMGFNSVWLTEHHFSSAPYVPDVSGEYCISASPFAR